MNLSTGPQAITGSTRMQATSSETWVIGCCLHVALDQYFREFLTQDEMKEIGFTQHINIQDKLMEFQSIVDEVRNELFRKRNDRSTDVNHSLSNVQSLI